MKLLLQGPRACAPISFGCPLSCGAAERDLLHLAQVRQQLLDAVLELREPGQRLRGLQFPGVVQPALQHCGQNRERGDSVTPQHLIRKTVNNNSGTKSHLSIPGRREGRATLTHHPLWRGLTPRTKLESFGAAQSNRTFCNNGNGVCLCCLVQ